MFEEEAEEYKDNTRIKDENTYIGFPNERISELQDFEGNYIDISERIIKAFKDGALFGYNKANEWHYVKDGDLPNTNLGRADVTVAYINAYENPCKRDCCFDGTNFIYWDARKPVGWKKADIFGKIYAWKYPEELPEPPKENE